MTMPQLVMSLESELRTPERMSVEENNLQSIGEQLMQALEAKNRARELALANSRPTIRHCAHSIRASHRGDLQGARELLKAAGDLVTVTQNELLSSHPDIYWAGYVQDAQKEYAEANIIYAVIAGERLPSAGD